MKALLKIRGPYTVFLPTNDAMFDYYTLKGVSGLEGFSPEFIEEVCRNHFVANFISSGDIGLDALPYENGLSDFLPSEFEGSDIVIAKYSKIINRDIYCSNGVIQVVDGWWEVSITFPKVIKGKYEIYLMQPPWGDVTDCVVSLDGVGTGITYTGAYGTGAGGLQKVADAVFETTAEHTITIRNIMAGMVFWDYVEFVPVK